MSNQRDVPMMFRAQIEGRCQLQYAQSGDVDRWVEEWEQAAAVEPPGFAEPIQTSRECKISWRFVTNGGQDDGIIRPVIDSMGMPFYPGSSMKGAFRKACERMEKAKELPLGTCDRYCGTKPAQKQRQDAEDGTKPGILRFHGGYSTNDWKQNLVDITHPQQGWQLGIPEQDKHSAFALISLYQPILQFGISSAALDVNWSQVWQIWDRALGFGIGCRVSAGYGTSDRVSGDVLYRVKLHGQGAASQTLDRQPEFRPNIFRAALRGHALRIFGGLNQAIADDIVDELFGGIRSKKEKVGFLRMAFLPNQPDWRSSDNDQAYDVTGDLVWLLADMADQFEHRQQLQDLVIKLTQFAMLLGGFGKSWRRADHLKFPLNKKIYDKHLIGCHWEWSNPDDNPVHNLDDATTVIQDTLIAAQAWMKARGYAVLIPAPETSSASVPSPERPKPKGLILKSDKAKAAATQTAAWRESWRADNVRVWGRTAANENDSKVISWLHSAPTGATKPDNGRNRASSSKPPGAVNNLALARPTNQPSSKPSIYRSAVTGRVYDERKDGKKTADNGTQIGRLWHRMYPLDNGQYLEVVTLFTKGCPDAEKLKAWLDSPTSGFQKRFPKQ
jgi:CRISPR-associated protein Cmr6